MNITINKQKLGVEDLVLDYGVAEQVRSGQTVDITGLAAEHIPYDGTLSIKEKIDNFSASIQDVNKLVFNKEAGETVAAGEMAWNATDETLDLGLDGEVTLQIGQELLARGKNTSGQSIANGTVLMVTGVIGNSGVIAVGPHDGSSANGHKIAGIATESLDINEIGFSLLRGKLRGINCTGTPYGETWNYGDALWVSPNGNGAMTNITPTITQLKMFVGIVINNTINGTIQVRTNGMDDHHFVEYVGTIEEFEGALI